MSLADYLNKNYGKDKTRSKKKDDKKRKANNSNIKIHDLAPKILKRPKSQPESESQSMQKSTSSSQTVNPRHSGWKVVGTDEIKTQAIDIDSSPKEYNTNTKQDSPQMESGAKAGLQTASDVTEQIRLKRERELSYLEKTNPESMGKDSETIHRDSTGRRININDKFRSDNYLKNQEKLEYEKKVKEMNMGLVQKLQLEKSNNSRNEGMTTYADDIKLNTALKQRQLEDDPLQVFTGSSATKGRYVSLTGRKLYRRGFPENRFNIAPGYRWDGVDRSNGFEKKWFKRQAENTTREKLSYTMQEDY